MAKKIASIFSTVVLATLSLWFFSSVLAAPKSQSNPGFSNLAVKLDKDSLKLGDDTDTTFNANIMLACTGETDEGPLSIHSAGSGRNIVKWGA